MEQRPHGRCRAAAIVADSADRVGVSDFEPLTFREMRVLTKNRTSTAELSVRVCTGRIERITGRANGASRRE